MSRAVGSLSCLVVGCLLLNACGNKESAESNAEATDAEQTAAEAGTADPPASGDKLGRFLDERVRGANATASAERPQPEQPTEQPPPSTASDTDNVFDNDVDATDKSKRKRSDDTMQAMLEAGRIQQDPNASEAERKAAMDKVLSIARGGGPSEAKLNQRPLNLPTHWAQTYRVEKDGNEAELLIQVGDIDNLGFGWPKQFDPFSGETTPVHPFPWSPEADDPPGTDRIMVVSGVKDKRGIAADGYTLNTKRPDNLPQAISIEFSPDAVAIKAAVLQLFVDDFQAPVWQTNFKVTLDGQSAPDMETTINNLNQTGPIGNLITIRLLPEYLRLLTDGKLQVAIDDNGAKKGDGFAFDFARLLINPKDFTYEGTIRGKVLDKATNEPIDGALVSAANMRQATTKADGKFELRDVPAGRVVTSGSHPDYITGTEQSDLLADQIIDVTIRLERARNEDLGERLENEGKVDLYGIYFDIDKDVLKPTSEATLQQVLSLLKSKPALRIALGGHTDSQASDAYNLDLSKRRAQAVVAWLTNKGIAASRLTAQGFGESQPVADNASEAGRALNRRVEIRDLSR